jgi:hypothetical protein
MNPQLQLVPPWIAHPFISWPSNEWTNGPAGFYLWQWEAWFRALGEPARDDYRTKYPEPAGWLGFYDRTASLSFPDIIRMVSDTSDFEVTFVSEHREYFSDASSGVPGDDDGLHVMMGRLVILLLREARAGGFNEIEIDNCGEACLIYFVQDGERFWHSDLPNRLIGPLKAHLDRICKMGYGQRQGAFYASLSREEAYSEPAGEFKISVVFEESRLRLTIGERQGTTP